MIGNNTMLIFLYSFNNLFSDMNECASNPCTNGFCQDGPNSYTCSCNAGWTGTNCNIGKWSNQTI